MRKAKNPSQSVWNGPNNPETPPNGYGLLLHRSKAIRCQVIHTIRDTPPNPSGLLALSTDSSHCYLAYPGIVILMTMSVVMMVVMLMMFRPLSPRGTASVWLYQSGQQGELFLISQLNPSQPISSYQSSSTFSSDPSQPIITSQSELFIFLNLYPLIQTHSNPSKPNPIHLNQIQPLSNHFVDIQHIPLIWVRGNIPNLM